MKKLATFIVFLLWIAAACSGQPETTPTPSLIEETVEFPSPTEPTTKQTNIVPTEAISTEPTEVETVATIVVQADSLPTLAPVDADYVPQPLPTDQGRYFAGSGVCSICHTDMQDEAGNNVSIDDFWRSTMMANAARDPY